MLSLSQFEARSANRNIRVALADHQALLSEALGLIIEREPGLVLVGSAHTCAAALQLALRTQPDVLLLEAALPDGDSLHLAATLRDVCPSTRILLLATQVDDAVRRQAPPVGTAGWLSKQASVDEVLVAIRQAAVRHRVGPMLPGRWRQAAANLSLSRVTIATGENEAPPAGRERRPLPGDGLGPQVQ